MSVPTPIVDAVLGDPLAVPFEVDGWLRGIERRARTLRSRTEDACAGSGVLPLLTEAHATLVAFLDDPASSALHRTLRRPLAQLAVGTPAQRSFGSLADFLFRRTEDALDLQAAADALRQRVHEVRERYGARAPHFTGVHLRAARVGEAELLRARRVADVRAMGARLDWAEAALERLWSRLPAEREGGDGAWEMTGDSGASADELCAALALRLPERGAPGRAAGTTRTLRATALRHLEALGGAAGWDRPARSAPHLVAERLAQEAARPDESLAPCGEDALLWGALLRTSQAALHDPRDEQGWQPRIRVEGPHQEEEAAGGATLWMVPVDDTYVLLTPEVPSAVRVASRGVRLGKAVDCRLFGIPGEPESLERARLEVAPFFDGIDSAEPGWYATRRNARFEVVGRHGANWFARIDRRGEAKRLRTAAWEEAAPEAGAVRLLGAAPPLLPGPGLETCPAGTPPVTFLGFRTHEVRTPLLDHRTAWLRTAVSPSAAVERALERERELFRLMGRAGVGLAPCPLGPARLAGSGTAGLLYGRPFALRLEDTPPLEQWLRRDSLAALTRAVARLLAAVHGTGHALGVCHSDAFSYGMDWRRLGAAPRPRATLVHAPFAARLGHAYEPLPDADTPRYPRIRFRGLPLPVARGETATPETDAAGFALFALELLAEKPLPGTRGWLGWGDLPGAVMEHADICFARPGLATELARSLADPAQWGALLRWQRELATPRKGGRASEPSSR